MAVRFLSSPFAADADAQTPRRMLAIQTDMGILPQYFWPEGRGMDYKPSPYLEILQDDRVQ